MPGKKTMKLLPCSNDDKEKFYSNLNEQFPGVDFREIFSQYNLMVNKKKDYYLLTDIAVKEYAKLKNLDKNLKYIGMYAGRMRKEFGIALEVLDLVYNSIPKEASSGISIKLNLKQTKAFLYGKDQTIKKSDLNKVLKINMRRKLFILDNFDDVIGLALLEFRQDQFTLKPIVDLGQYLRSERTGMFGN